MSSTLVRSTSLVNGWSRRRAHNITTDELSQALEIAQGAAATTEEMLEGILRFGDTTAAEIMTPRIGILDLEVTMPFDRVMEIVLESGYSRLRCAAVHRMRLSEYCIHVIFCLS